MVIFDINNMLKGLDIDTFAMLIKDYGILIYDSQQDDKGVPPIVTGDNKLALIDINSISEEDIELLNKVIDDKNANDDAVREVGVKVLKENNEKLIKYLKDINDKTEGKHEK